ncbi:hypothetical protein [Stutzerimonas stutzeri]|uniref:hypothetical protein n=1 Tax=Stutzerimonas stutzeri TaxID=316 RepID=UPI00210C200D|nr:hypothetical protein [Stutzerimonas stutzeri]MCQ4322421.1 hypothetical protein [Stutzerimonas stutzeri]
MLVSSIAAVEDEASALAAIGQIAAKYGSAPNDASGDHESNTGEVNVHLLPATAQHIEIGNFETNLDQFGMLSELTALVGSLTYVGEPDTLEELHTRPSTSPA